jgi:4-hydroxybenzoate polyprenyltransferase
MTPPSPPPNEDAATKGGSGAPVPGAKRGDNRFTALIALLRPKQWVKNLFCLAGVVFGAKASQPEALTQALEVFCAFSAIASAMYVFNDLMDREADARHQQKRFRPIASGAVSPRKAVWLGLLCAAIAVIAVTPLGIAVAAIILAYAVLSIAYTLWLKRFPLIDVMFIATGFLLRIFAGTEAVHVPASAWILLCTLFLSLFLGFAKRRAEMTSHGASGESREVLLHYSVPLLDRFCYMFATLSMAAYAIFTTSNAQQRTLILTCPPVIYGILRYLWLMERHEGHEQIEITLFRDRPIQITILLWIALHLAVIYGGLRLNIQ